MRNSLQELKKSAWCNLLIFCQRCIASTCDLCALLCHKQRVARRSRLHRLAHTAAHGTFFRWCSNGSKFVTNNSNYISFFAVVVVVNAVVVCLFACLLACLFLLHITAHIAYASTNQTKIVSIQTELFSFFFTPG